MRSLRFAALAAFVAPAYAGPPVIGPQLSIPVDPATIATKADIASVRADMPVAADSVPPNEMVGGSVGQATQFRRADAAAPRISRAATVSTDATGGWSVTWAAPLLSVPVILPIPVNPGTQPVVCNVTTRTMTGATGKCWLARTLPATILTVTALVAYDLFGGPASATTVQILAIPPTQ